MKMIAFLIKKEFFLSSNLVARAHIIKCEEVKCLGFKLQPLHITCNISTSEVSGVQIPAPPYYM